MNEIEKFLSESNKIEEVFDDDSLKQALHAWDYLSKQKRLTLGVILKTHKILMLHQSLMPNEKGYFRLVNVRVGDKVCPAWFLVPSLLSDWLKQWGDVKTAKKIKQAHVEFEKIHGFLDGNGRLGRMIMNYQRSKNRLSPLIIKEKDRWDYYSWFD